MAAARVSTAVPPSASSPRVSRGASVPDGRREREVDVLVVGAGPGGLAVAPELATRGAGRVEVVDREQEAGGIPRHSVHTGYGLRALHGTPSGAAFAHRPPQPAGDARA